VTGSDSRSREILLAPAACRFANLRHSGQLVTLAHGTRVALRNAMTMPRSRPLDVVSSRPRLKTLRAVTLWRPQIVLATSIVAPPARPSVILAEPTARPEALHTQLGDARSLLASLDDVRQVLGTVAAEARDRAGRGASTREQVSATIAAYRAEAALDDVLTGAWRRVSALMEERGLR
jgi:hypothetical protein